MKSEQVSKVQSEMSADGSRNATILVEPSKIIKEKYIKSKNTYSDWDTEQISESTEYSNSFSERKRETENK